jgi:hypothetical protein
VYEHAVIKKSEHRGCCYLNGTKRIPVKGKVRKTVPQHWQRGSRGIAAMDSYTGDGRAG